MDSAYRSAVEIREGVREGEVSATAVVGECLDRIDARNDATNAFCTVASERARERAREIDDALTEGERVGPLCGVPIGVKDLIDVAGVRTTYGSVAFAEHVPEESNVVVSRLEDAGAVVVGKTNTPEFGRKPMTTNDLRDYKVATFVPLARHGEVWPKPNGRSHGRQRTNISGGKPRPKRGAVSPSVSSLTK